LKVPLRSRIACACTPILALLILVLLPGRLSAQVDAGEVTGTVRDASGAAVVNTKLSLTNEETGVRATALSTSTGSYLFDAVKPGTYTVEADAPNFEKYVNHGAIVHVQQTLAIDITLVPGSVSQQVTVTAAAPLLQAEDAAIGQTIDGKTVNDLPLLGRNWVSLAQLSAGVSTAPPTQPSTNAGQTGSAYFSVNGVNLWQNDVRLNGINDNIEVYGGSKIGTNATITPPPDAIQEFKLQSGDFNAEFGHSTGGIVNAVTKSGTNRLNGDLWEYVRNNDLQANDYFSNLNGKPIAEYHQNQFGGTLGGPISIPHLYSGKNRSFFFASYQGLLNRQALSVYSPSTSLLNTVPTAAMQSSGFTNLQDLINDNSGTPTVDALGRKFPLGTVLDPATTRSVAGNSVDPVSGLANSSSSAVYVRDPFYTGSLLGKTDFTGDASSLNMLPAQRLDPNAIKLLQLYPEPTTSGFANNFFYNPILTNNENQGDVRFDQTLGPKDTMFVSADYSHIIYDIPALIPGAIGQTDGQSQSYPAYAIAGGYNHVFSPSLINEFHVGYDHFIENVRSLYGNTMGIPASYGIQGIPQVANNGGLPPISITGLHNMGVGNYTPTLETIYALEVMDNLTKTHASHTFKMGFQLDSLEGDIIQPPSSRGNFTYSGQYSDVVNKARGLNGIADMLLTPIAATVPNGVSYSGGLTSFNGSNYAATDDHRYYWGAYFQDDWKVTPSLTLNLGVRWDYFTPYSEVNGRQANTVLAGGNGSSGTYYVPNKGCQVARASAFNTLLASSGINLQCVSNNAVGNAQETNFAPRVGFAYRILPNLVARGGYGIAYGALANIGYGGTLGQNYPFIYNIASPNTNTSVIPITLANGQTATVENTFGTINLTDPTQITGLGVSLYGRQYNYQTPYVETFNFMVQDQFTPHDSFQAGYVGNVGRHLDNYYNTLNSASEILPPGTAIANYLPLPKFAANTTYETTNAVSSYNAMQATYEHQTSLGLSLLANYTYSKCMSDQRTQAKTAPSYRAPWLPNFGINADYSVCDVDAASVVHLSGTYDLPVGRGRMFASGMNRAEDAILGGWSVNFIYSYQSGQPLNIGCATSTTADFGCNANVVPGQGLYAGPHNRKQWLNPAAFATPAVATAIGQTDYSPLGSLGQQARGPGFNNVDSSLFKNFTVSDAVRVQFRAEAFNTFNSAQFAQPSSTNYTNTTTFGSITSLRNGPRVMQLALKLFY
jgi:Carboxypeptidase regulatory-like domain/TonB dependent receptor